MSLPGYDEYRMSVRESSTRQALDGLQAQLQGFLGMEHNADGTHPFGTWVSEPYAATLFTANGTMTWTVPSQNIVTHGYMKIGKTLWITFYAFGTTVGGAANTELRLAIPGGFIPTRGVVAAMPGTNGGAGIIGVSDVEQGQGYVGLYKDPTFGTNWAAGATDIYLQCAIEVQ